ncbi:lysophospholipid acyltransferase family protein [Embleya sp. NPDC059237]|uniref:lysophospholipid acyltransferase family protein n=1 Tax=Embleya sp. NPDC059237 TaxID=3346784 RepID=UPI0036CC9E5D
MFYRLMKMIVGPVLRLFFRPWVEGQEHIPDRGPAILASNHLSFSDSFFLPVVVPRRITFLAKSDYFTGRGVKGRLTAAFFKGVGQLPVDRSGGRASEAALNAGLKVLREDHLFGIYPEGTRSPDGRLYRGKTGIARLALESGAPVIPVAMIDTEKIQPPGKIVPKIMRVGIRIGEPLDFSRYEGMEDDRFILRAITDEIIYALMELSGQEYVDMYAADAKKRIDEARKQAAAAKAAEKAAEQGAGQGAEQASGQDTGKGTDRAADPGATSGANDDSGGSGRPAG